MTLVAHGERAHHHDNSSSYLRERYMNQVFVSLARALLVASTAAAVSGAHAQSVNEQSARQSLPATLTAQSAQGGLVQPQLSAGSYSTYCLYRFSGSHVIVRCNDSRINANSRAFIALSEYSSNGPTDRFIGAARMTVHNIRPFNGGLEAWVDVEWGSPLNVRMDILIDP